MSLHSKHIRSIAFGLKKTKNDLVRQRVLSEFSSFEDLSEDNHVKAARKINVAQVDVLVDISGYTITPKPEVCLLFRSGFTCFACVAVEEVR